MEEHPNYANSVVEADTYAKSLEKEVANIRSQTEESFWMKVDELFTGVNKTTKDAITECDRLRCTLEDTTVQLARARTEAEHLKARNVELEAQLTKAQSQLEKSQQEQRKSKEDMSVILFKANLQRDEAKSEVAKLLKCQTDLEQLHTQKLEELRKNYTEAKTKADLFELELDKLFQERCYLTAKVSDAEQKVINARQALERCTTAHLKQLERVKLTAQQREDDLLRDHYFVCEDFAARLQQANALIGQYRTLVANMQNAYASGIQTFESDVSQILAQHENLTRTDAESKKICCSDRVVSLKKQQAVAQRSTNNG
ncbi:hypothetical protein P879_06756 [Paragonimus westermani]|uniref:Uncharacterized protein n=1 Tax=Paragonimus westermani TaxID=34504 RepID=A0A8T0DFV1_9TREM|nr:hypothetical protein P879_06756 [Paragonimus westermani]